MYSVLYVFICLLMKWSLILETCHIFLNLEPLFHSNSMRCTTHGVPWKQTALSCRPSISQANWSYLLVCVSIFHAICLMFMYNLRLNLNLRFNIPERKLTNSYITEQSLTKCKQKSIWIDKSKRTNISIILRLRLCNVPKREGWRQHKLIQARTRPYISIVFSC